MKKLFSFIGALLSLLKTPRKKGWAGTWENEKDFIRAIYKLRGEGFKKFEAITPFPLHEVEEAMQVSRSKIPWVTFVFGLLGALFGIWFTWWTSSVNWPINVGGTPMWSIPAFFPIIFELTILFSALSSVVALFIICGLPRLNPPIIDANLTSHQFALFVEETKEKQGSEEFEKKVEEVFKQMGAIKIVKTDF